MPGEENAPPLSNLADVNNVQAKEENLAPSAPLPFASHWQPDEDSLSTELFEQPNDRLSRHQVTLHWTTKAMSTVKNVSLCGKRRKRQKPNVLLVKVTSIRNLEVADQFRTSFRNCDYAVEIIVVNAPGLAQSQNAINTCAYASLNPLIALSDATGRGLSANETTTTATNRHIFFEASSTSTHVLVLGGWLSAANVIKSFKLANRAITKVPCAFCAWSAAA
eukprot:g5371.t1